MQDVPIHRRWALSPSFLALTDGVIEALRKTSSNGDLRSLMSDVAAAMGFRYFALIHHEDLSSAPPGRVDLKEYPMAAVERLFGQRLFRRDPVIRGCIFADSAFLWSDLSRIIQLDRKDRALLEGGAREGLNEGITVPCTRLGECMGSCTFAGIRKPDHAQRFLGPAQMVGIFAFQAARRLVSGFAPPVPSRPRLHPRPRDCIVLAGQGLSNKEIARALSITPRTVDGYMTEARRLFNVHDRMELVVSAVLAGEIGLHELRPRQPE